jgi:hypothetical protein
MTRFPLAERAVMGLARVIAGRERRLWIDAMEAELVHLPERRMDWALGSLVAATKDRAAREWQPGFVLLGLSGAAVAAAVLSALPIALLAKLTGTAILPWQPLAVLAPLPFAYLLGRIRPHRSPLWLGATGFLAYQIMPVIAWRATIGDGAWFTWGPNLWPLGVPYRYNVLAVLLVWRAGAWWGAKVARDRAPTSRSGSA